MPDKGRVTLFILLLMNLRIRTLRLVLLFCGIGCGLWATRLATVVNTEEAIVDFVISQITEGHSSTSEEIQATTKIIGSFLNPRREYNESVHFYREGRQLIQNSPIITVIVNGGGSCGYSSELGVRVFERLGYSARLIQVIDEEQSTRHVVMDASKDGVHAVIDPIFGHVHLDNSGGFASIEFLIQHWEQVKEELPKNSKISLYTYEHGVRFTNWNRFGTFSDKIQSIVAFVGFDPNTISLRIWSNHFRRMLPKLLYCSTVIFLMLILWIEQRNSEQ